MGGVGVIVVISVFHAVTNVNVISLILNRLPDDSKIWLQDNLWFLKDITSYTVDVPKHNLQMYVDIINNRKANISVRDLNLPNPTVQNITSFLDGMKPIVPTSDAEIMTNFLSMTDNSSLNVAGQVTDTLSQSLMSNAPVIDATMQTTNFIMNSIPK